MADEHPDLQNVGASMRDEWRTEQEAATQDAAEAFQHRRSLSDLLTEHMHRGDRLALTVAGYRITGSVEEVGPDLVALRTLFGRVDVHRSPTIPLYFEVFERATEGGSRGSDAAGGSFHRALELREREEDCTVGTLFDADGYDGKIRVGADFVTIVARAGAETTIPIPLVSWISARRD
jgi:hypothetical protein